MANAGEAPPSETPPGPDSEQDERQSQRQRQSEQREAYEYWGYMFKEDKTGTDKLKSLLRGLKDVINQTYEPSDQPDLTPNQLAHFYRDLHGNYDQLFLGTPNESIAFIYKSLGCLHSLQPLHHSHGSAFTDPTVPALKTEGWIMWQTIQLLLAPEIHASFIREAVQKWDIPDRTTGQNFPKILPRECFPLSPDKHMVDWYEGVSERLRREAEQEERHRTIEVEHEDPRKPRDRPPYRREGDMRPDDDASVDSRGPALAYFRNPLYRHTDGRPSIVRRVSRRPGLSPRPTMVDRGKEAASTFGHVVRNVASPHLWDGHGGSRSGSRDPERDRRRRSHDDRYHHAGDPPPSDMVYNQRFSPRDRPPPTADDRRRRASHPERSGGSKSGDDEWNDTDGSPMYTPTRTASNSSRRPYRNRGPSDSRPVSETHDQVLRPSRSHEPTPNQDQGGEDYFSGHGDPPNRRNSTASPLPGSAANNGVGPSFEPSASPLFASHVARQPQAHRPAQPPPPQSQNDHYGGGPDLRSNHSVRRAQQDRYPSRSPDRHPRPSRSRNSDARERPHSHYDPSPYERPHSQYDGQAPYDDRDRNGANQQPPQFDGRYNESPAPSMAGGDPPSRERERDRDRHRDRDRDRDRERDRRSARLSGSDVSGYHSGEDGSGSRRSRTKQKARFAETGVGGRRYPEGGSPWRRGDDR